MPEYLAPGVYIEESSGGAKPIEAVGTSTACFIGFTEKAEQAKVIEGEKQYKKVVGEPIFITSWEEYVDTFGGFVPEFYTPLSVYGFFQNGGKRCYVVSLRAIPKASKNIISRGKGQENKPSEYLKIEAKAPGENGKLLRTTIESVVDPVVESPKTPWQFTLRAQETPADGQAATPEMTEELTFELTKEERNGREVIGFRLVNPSDSKLIELSAINANQPPDWAALKAVAPTSGGAVTLSSISSQNLPSNQPYLQVKRKKSVNDAKPVTVTVISSAAEKAAAPTAQPSEKPKPRFMLNVERLHPVTKKWDPKEKRAVSLYKEKKAKTDAQGVETPIEVLKVEYLDGQRPTLVDVVVLAPDADVTHIDLTDLWPETQTTSLAAPTTLAIADAKLLEPAEYSEYQGKSMERTGIEGLAEIDDINFICMPDLMKAWGMPKDQDKEWGKKYVQSVQALAIAHCDRLANRMVILDTPRDMNPQEVKNWRMDEARYDSSRAVLYYPWIEVMDPATNQTTFVPPSGFVAGIWARNDTNRGVHKAPANEVVQLAVGLKYEVGQGHQEILNPNGINCIRPLRGMGIRVWGARTLSQSDPEWKYVNVRRLFHMIEQSIQRSTMWAVFEPNDHRLWAKLRRDVRNFLMTIYSQGMLFGATPAQAFFVKCDEENNPKYTRDLGQVIVDIGVAPVKPAEFVIFRIRQWSPEDEQA